MERFCSPRSGSLGGFTGALTGNGSSSCYLHSRHIQSFPFHPVLSRKNGQRGRWEWKGKRRRAMYSSHELSQDSLRGLDTCSTTWQEALRKGRAAPGPARSRSLGTSPPAGGGRAGPGRWRPAEGRGARRGARLPSQPRTVLSDVAARFPNKKEACSCKRPRWASCSPTLLEAKPIYEALLSANKSLGFNGEAAAAEDVVICI
nr:uncharacterized protein LOC116281809 [Vicugna pacos]